MGPWGLLSRAVSSLCFPHLVQYSWVAPIMAKAGRGVGGAMAPKYASIEVCFHPHSVGRQIARELWRHDYLHLDFKGFPVEHQGPGTELLPVWGHLREPLLRQCLVVLWVQGHLQKPKPTESPMFKANLREPQASDSYFQELQLGLCQAKS